MVKYIFFYGLCILFWIFLFYCYLSVYKKEIFIFKNYEVDIAKLYGWDIAKSGRPAASRNIALLEFKNVKIRTNDSRKLNKNKLPLNSKFLVAHEKDNPYNFILFEDFDANNEIEIENSKSKLADYVQNINNKGLLYRVFRKQSIYIFGFLTILAMLIFHGIVKISSHEMFK